MDKEGFVPLVKIAEFKRIKQVTVGWLAGWLINEVTTTLVHLRIHPTNTLITTNISPNSMCPNDIHPTYVTPTNITPSNTPTAIYLLY